MKNISTLLLIFLAISANTYGQQYKVEKTGIFKPPTEKKILLFSKAGQTKKIILFHSKLRVNTDGNPKSYHPDDFDGTTLAINSLCNGIGVYQKDVSGKEVRITNCARMKQIFELFKNNNYVEPNGYRINWQNVIAARNGKPCIFQDGDFKDYFVSLTSEKNGLPSGARGECGYKNQLDAVTIPHLVLPAKNWEDSNKVVHINPLHTYGTKKGDLVFTYNASNSVWSYAVIGDNGPGDNLGEGSVALNMKLKGQTDVPKTYIDAKKLDTGTNKIFVAIIPNSNSSSLKPYTAEKIETRGKELIREMGFSDEQDFITFIVQQKSKF